VSLAVRAYGVLTGRRDGSGLPLRPKRPSGPYIEAQAIKKKKLGFYSTPLISYISKALLLLPHSGS